MNSTNQCSDTNRKKMQKMSFIYNALENGWIVKKKNDTYIFYKKHENKREIFDNNYLEHFLETNITLHGI